MENWILCFESNREILLKCHLNTQMLTNKEKQK